jgi:hypothetical protein
MSEGQSVQIKNRPLQCKHCGRGQFVHRNAQLNTSFLEFFDLGWLNKSADVYICTCCGLLHWFLDPQVEGPAPVEKTGQPALVKEAQEPIPVEEAALPDDLSEPAACLACGQRIPAGSDKCPSCGWSYK